VTNEAQAGLLFDECVDRLLTVPAFAPIREITFSRDHAPGADDSAVMVLARRLGVILVTEDVGFGRLTFQKALAPPVGIILIALHPMPRGERAPYLAHRAPDALARAVGAFVTIGARGIRARRFPTRDI
jgi:predicted nuclease of predicted toxin-antitoxin system